mmetsp:Transcript_36485/g.71645  ORF Transcript_36485/g.71645 Transcript_36485/m.71645 type:complete len:156 (+) Transcript_36485:118-585(+)
MDSAYLMSLIRFIVDQLVFWRMMIQVWSEPKPQENSPSGNQEPQRHQQFCLVPEVSYLLFKDVVTQVGLEMLKAEVDERNSLDTLFHLFLARERFPFLEADLKPFFDLCLFRFLDAKERSVVNAHKFRLRFRDTPAVWKFWDFFFFEVLRQHFCF